MCEHKGLFAPDLTHHRQSSVFPHSVSHASVWPVHAASGHRSNIRQLSFYSGIFVHRVKLLSTLLCLPAYYFPLFR